MGLNYRNMSEEYVYPKRDELQKEVLDRVEKFEASLLSSGNETSSKETVSITLGNFQTEIQEYVVSSWWTLADLLVVRYNDGYFNFPEWAPNSVKIIDIPSWFMRMIGFSDSFIVPTEHWFVPFKGTKEEAIDFGIKHGPLSRDTAVGLGSPLESSGRFSWVEVVVSVLLVGFAMFGMGKRFGEKKVLMNGSGDKNGAAEGYSRLLS
jgi:hypothetical protein